MAKHLEARRRLADAARHVKAPDYRVSNPITQANASFKMRESADPRDRLVADLQERVSATAALRTKIKDRLQTAGPPGRITPEVLQEILLEILELT
ncbi:MAG TPA: hypothetical protein VGM32_13690 [Rhodopila sp.]|jgi:hypothetical protein